jgi:hypothetical protein
MKGYTMKKAILFCVLALALFAVPAFAQAFQCVIAPGAAIVSDPIGPQFGTLASPPTFQLFDGGLQIASGNMVPSSSITQGTPLCSPAEAPYNPGPAGSWAMRTATGALAIGSTHTYTAILTCSAPTCVPPLPGPLTVPLVVTVVASLPTAPPAPPLSVRN